MHVCPFTFNLKSRRSIYVLEIYKKHIKIDNHEKENIVKFGRFKSTYCWMRLKR